MKDIELEEGEAYFPQDDDQYNEDIDPDKDLSYIDKKIENVLGHYQKDFMGGLSAESLGARYGGYGSFLPMQQRSPGILSNQGTQSQIISKPSPKVPSENSTVVANHSLPGRSGPALSNHSIRALPESGTCSMNNQSKLQISHDGSSNDDKPMMHHSAPKSLKLRVKMTSESAFSRDKSAIYSGLGLDMSPSSSLEDSPSDSYGDSPDILEMKVESPSYIVKIMTSFPLPNKEVLSPLHHSLVSLLGTENNLANALLGCSQAFPLEGKSKPNKDRKSKVMDPSKDRKSKEKELGKERKSKKKLHLKPVELVKENHEYPTNVFTLSASKREESANSLDKDVVLSKASTDAFDVLSYMVNKKHEVGCLEDVTEKSMQPVEIARDKTKGRCVATSSHDTPVLGKGNVKAFGGKMEKEKKIICVTSKKSQMGRRNEVGLKEEDANKLVKQLSVTNDKVKDVVLCSRFPEAGVYVKENGTQKKIVEDQEVSLLPIKIIEEKEKHHDLSSKMMDLNVEGLEPARQKSHSKVMPHSQMGVGLSSGKKHSSLATKKLWESQADGTSSAERPRGNLAVGSLAPENEEAVFGSNVRHKSKRDGKNLQRGGTKDSGLAGNINPGKKEKGLSMKDTAMGVSNRESLAFNDKLKEKSSCKNAGFDSNIGVNMEGHLCGGISVMERMPVGDVPSTEMEDWVLCENCGKWRLLPLGVNPDSLPKEWTCSMITWLPGKNSCSVSEDETTNGLRALYQVPVLGPPLQNVQLSYPDGTASQHVSAGGQHVDVISGGCRKKNSAKTQIHAPRQSGSQKKIPVKQDQQHSGQMKSSKHQKNLLRELDAARPTGDCKPSKLEKKRVTELKASGVPKKMKRIHEKSMQSVGLSMSDSQNYYSGAQQISDDFVKIPESPLTNAKDRNTEIKDVFKKKRKLKEQWESVVPTEGLSDETWHPVNNLITGRNSGTEHRKEKKLKVSNTKGREYNAEKGNGRKSSEKALGLGLSDSATTSSSSKISLKVRAKVKCSPIGSISSSPFGVSKSDHGNEPDNLSAKQLKCKADGATNEITPHKEKMRDRKSNLSRNPGIVSDAVDQDCSVGKMSAGRHQDAPGIDKPKLEGHKNTSAKSNRIIHESRSLRSQQKSKNQDPRCVKGLHFHESNSEKGKSHLSLRSSEKEPACHSHVLPAGHLSKATEASSSMRKDVFHCDANVALKEATNLKDSADLMKISGSGLESTGVFFQAALKYLHGASLLEPGSNEGGKYSEMTPTAAYITTARLCENCAHEYERCNDMASAALAYKCMEVAYMKVIYANDLAASRDRVALDMVVRAAPQVESPSSSASDIDSLNNQAVGETSKDRKSLDQQNHVIFAGNRPHFVRLLNFTQHVNLAMDASRRSLSAFAAASPVLSQSGKREGIALIKSVLDFSFHDIDGLLHLIRLAVEALNNKI